MPTIWPSLIEIEADGPLLAFQAGANAELVVVTVPIFEASDDGELWQDGDAVLWPDGDRILWD